MTQLNQIDSNLPSFYLPESYAMLQYNHANLLIRGSRSLSQAAAECTKGSPFYVLKLFTRAQCAVLLLYSSKLFSNITIACKSTVAMTCIHTSAEG